MDIDWKISVPHLVLDIIVLLSFLGLMLYARGVHFKCQNICEYQGEICYNDYVCHKVDNPMTARNNNTTTGGVFKKELPIQFINTIPNITKLRSINKKWRDKYGE